MRVNSEIIKSDKFAELVKNNTPMHLIMDKYIENIPDVFTSIDPRYDLHCFRKFPDKIRQKFTDELVINGENRVDNKRRSVLLKNIKRNHNIELGNVNHLIISWCENLNITAKSITGNVIVLYGWKININNNLNHIYIDNSGHIKFPHAILMHNHDSIHINDDQ